MTKANWSMIISLSGPVIALLSFAYAFGVVNTKVERMEIEHVRRIQVTESSQAQIGTVQREQAVQGAVQQNLRDDVQEIKEDNKAIKEAIELQRRETGRLRQEQNENFQKLFEAIE